MSKKILAKLFSGTAANVRLLSYQQFPLMKNLSFIFFPAFILIFSCNSSSTSRTETTDSLQQLLGSIRDSIKNNPPEPRLKYNLAVVLQDAGRYKEALLALDSMNVTQGDSTNLRIYFAYLFKKSELFELAGDTVNAIKTLEQLVIPGELTQAGLNLAHLYAETNNPKTIPFCNAIIKNDKEGLAPEPNFIKGIYYSNIGDYNHATTEFDSSIHKDYNFTEAHLEKGVCLYKLGRYVDAMNVFDKAISISHSFADAYYWKGKCQEALGQKAEAKLNYQRAYGLDRTLTEAKEAAKKIID
ncbi:MAG: tetratricopeptide repeat protein [Chitinophagaceae bacterium]|nr:MAG: tetratricopeptide repeat protein [Chitinophagaceae bacterium]